MKLTLSRRARLLALAALGAIAMLGGCLGLMAHALTPAMLDRSQLVPTFDEEFGAPPSFWNAQTNPNGRWKTNFFNVSQDADATGGWESRTIAVNGEGEYYGDPAAGMNPFEWRKGQLVIVGKPNPFIDDVRTHHQPYLSGLITTEKSFSQRYGYFEIRASLPKGTGIWPAFWLLPEPVMVDGWKQAGQQEIDIFESIGEPNKLYFTNFIDDNGRKIVDNHRREFYTSADLSQFHNYGVLLTPRDIVWYFDNQEVRRRPNLDFHMPAYMLVNLAIGGNWLGMPDTTTPFPARLRVAWVKAYRIK